MEFKHYPIVDSDDLLSQGIISHTLAEAQSGLKTAINDYIVSLFGTEENVLKYGHDYVLEESPIEFETSEDRMDNSTKFRITTRVRLRPKTPEEREADETP